MHDYYKNRICNEITIKPTPSTVRIIRNYNLIFKRTLGGFSLAADAVKDFSHIVFKDSFEMDFEFKFTNVYFHSFTELSPDPETKYLIDENEDFVVLNQSKANFNPSLNRAGLSGILRIRHSMDSPLLPLRSNTILEIEPKSKIVVLTPRMIKPVYLCYAPAEKFDRFAGLTVEKEGVFKELLSFGEPEQTVIEGLDIPAYKISAKNPIQMKSSWDGFIRLEKSDQFGFYKKILPNPSSRSLKLDLNTNSYISENYVKL
jgi:hypothetical protein